MYTVALNILQLASFLHGPDVHGPDNSDFIVVLVTVVPVWNFVVIIEFIALGEL